MSSRIRVSLLASLVRSTPSHSYAALRASLYSHTNSLGMSELPKTAFIQHDYLFYAILSRLFLHGGKSAVRIGCGLPPHRKETR